VNQEYHGCYEDISVTLIMKVECGVLKPQMLYSEVD